MTITEPVSGDEQCRRMAAAMAEVGYAVEYRYLDSDRFQFRTVEIQDADFYRAMWQAMRLSGAQPGITEHWCADHFAARRLVDRTEFITGECPCHSGTSGYEQGESS